MQQRQHLSTFFATHPVFQTDELLAFLEPSGSTEQTRRNMLHYHVRAGHIIPVRRGLYATVRPEHRSIIADSAPVDPFLIASRSTDDAVLAYHTALEFHGHAYTVTQQFVYLTARAARPFSFRAQRFVGVPFPAALTRRGAERVGVVQADRSGVDVHVTSLERTFVDVLDRPDLGGGWEELWRSLESVPYFNLDAVIEYALLLDNATTIAKVGFYLEQHRQSLMVEERHLARLRPHRPKGKHYLDRRARGQTRLLPEWHLVVPLDVLERSWEEDLGEEPAKGSTPRTVGAGGVTGKASGSPPRTFSEPIAPEHAEHAEQAEQAEQAEDEALPV